MKQAIDWLSSGQVNEELAGYADDDNGGPGRYGDDLNKHFLPVYSPALPRMLSLQTSNALPHPCEGLHRRHADDIPTPPPNC